MFTATVVKSTSFLRVHLIKLTSPCGALFQLHAHFLFAFTVAVYAGKG